MHYMEFQIAMTLFLSNSFIMTKKKKKKKGHFHILFDCLNSLICCSFPFLCLKCVLVIGHCGSRNIKVSSVKNPALTNVFP